MADGAWQALTTQDEGPHAIRVGPFGVPDRTESRDRSVTSG